MKIKIKSLIIGIVIGLIIATVGLGGVYYFTLEDVEWRAYIEDVLLPNAVTALGAAGTVALALRAMLSTVKEAAEKFGGATSLIKLSVEECARSKEELLNGKNEMLAGRAELLEGLVALSEKSNEIAAFVDELGVVATSLSDVKEMLRLGFGNMDELVRKGSARKIMKVGDTSEEKKLEDTAVALAPVQSCGDAGTAGSDIHSEQGEILLGAEGNG